ncbi:MAG: PfkB family carbohydrate kinase [Myxococcota bacterium]
MRVAVVGHVEWVTFLSVDRAPQPGAILHADESWEEPAGGGGGAAGELARLAGRSALFTAWGSDERGLGLGAAMAPLGVDVRGAQRPEPHRRAVTLVDPGGERTIVVVGPAQGLRAGEVTPADFADLDGVYFCKGDAEVLRCARAARVLVATARVLDLVRESGVELDALVHSARDPGERYTDGDLAHRPRLVARTDGEHGGTYHGSDGSKGRWDAVPAASIDSYGCGDRFAAGLTWALASGLGAPEALATAAASGAFAVGVRGAHGAR